MVSNHSNNWFLHSWIGSGKSAWKAMAQPLSEPVVFIYTMFFIVWKQPWTDKRWIEKMRSCFSYLNVNLDNGDTHAELRGQDFVSMYSESLAVSLRYSSTVWHTYRPSPGISSCSLGLFVTESCSCRGYILKGEKQPQHPSHAPFHG